MKLSIFVPITKPEYRQDPWRESILNFTEFADEVVIVCGDKSDLDLDFPNKDKIKLVYNKWRSEDYTIYGEQYGLGFNATTGDFAIKCDPDYLFHEDDWEDIRYFLEQTEKDILFMPKKQFILVDRFRVKAMMPIVFRGSLRGQIKFNAGGDYCWPTINGVKVVDKNNAVTKKEYVIISDDLTKKQVSDRLPNLMTEDGQTFCMNKRIQVYNYDFCFKTKDVITREFFKQSKARKNKTGSGWGDTPDEAIACLLNMQLGRLRKGGWEMFPIYKHPEHIKERIRNISKDELGFDLFGNFKEGTDERL